jgi:hypothetical protein
MQMVYVLRWYGLFIDIDIVDFDLLVPAKYRVWGSGYTQKLSLKANYLRFYAPEIMSTKYGARSFLYLDSDTLFVNSGLLKLFSTPSPNAVASGVQMKRQCWFGKIIDLQDARVSRMHIRNDEPCLMASVMLVNVSEWRHQNVTHNVEKWLAANMEKKLWNLGSMPPLMLAIHNKWTQLGNIYDGKATGCKDLHKMESSGALLVHPMKDLSCADLCAPPILCQPDHDAKHDKVGVRTPSIMVAALAKLLGAQVHGNVDERCSIVFHESDIRIAQHAQSAIWIQVGVKDPYRKTSADFVEVDSTDMYDAFATQGLKPIHVVEARDVEIEAQRYIAQIGEYNVKAKLPKCL